MDEFSDSSVQKGLLAPKRKILLAIVGWALLNTLAALFIEPRLAPQFGTIFLVIGAIGYGVLILAWAKADSHERGEELPSGWKFMLVVLGGFTLIAYFFKTRGFARGLLSIAYMIGFSVVAFLFSTIVAAVLLIISGMVFGFPTINS
ncbi:MAG TPA: hypothetical protein VGO43_11035 [Pyrinomonadaceae bacterium]|jgi:hypothetical protein|nr:hypothetical protein [Pyrinomonadaceae bacterium]